MLWPFSQSTCQGCARHLNWPWPESSHFSYPATSIPVRIWLLDMRPDSSECSEHSSAYFSADTVQYVQIINCFRRQICELKFRGLHTTHHQFPFSSVYNCKISQSLLTLSFVCCAVQLHLWSQPWIGLKTHIQPNLALAGFEKIKSSATLLSVNLSVHLVTISSWLNAPSNCFAVWQPYHSIYLLPNIIAIHHQNHPKYRWGIKNM